MMRFHISKEYNSFSNIITIDRRTQRFLGSVFSEKMSLKYQHLDKEHKIHLLII